MEVLPRRGVPDSRFQVGPETLSRQNPSKTIEFFQYVRKVECQGLVVLTPYGFATISAVEGADALHQPPR